MKDNNGKVILSLLVGATAGVVAGLLLAPETGEETRTGLKKSASKWSDGLGKLLKDSLNGLNLPKTGAATADTAQEGRSAADDVLNSMSQNSSPGFDDADSDYDGSGGDARHSGSGYGRSL
ncbi:YtxH domain-containing protein [Hymenobacter lucidus]|uniref:YtxH domain-containing protein n=1 Tax=Hymenobacter lucidus TaxID=2880930 RepID=A0ABS8ASS8_9BACT|nr:YtxH domain-containing protein [Hymenobacter lucidus]MCB2408406.1 YtxH domain-containing protein [Hymenobacter lucidus]